MNVYRYLRHLLWLVCTFTVTVFAAEQAKVFPVQGVFYDAAADSKLDLVFRESLTQQEVVRLGRHIHDALTLAFDKRVGKIDQRSAGNTFAVSFHITRANSFAVDKGNGNSDLVATLTGGVYYTNVVSGEILTTLSRTVISRSVVANRADLKAERRVLFKQALDTLIGDLVSEAPKQFQPVIIETRLADKTGDLLIFDAGYRQGMAAGDRIEDSADNLIEIVYAGENYSVGRPVLVSNISTGVLFQKFSAHPASGKDRPRVAVLIDRLPEGYAKDHIARLFAELLGDAAPLSVVQINTGFTRLLQTVREQDGVDLNSLKTVERRPPNFIVRLRIPEAQYHETGTNLDYEKQRRYETRAFADVIDASGRIIFSAIGLDVITDKIVRGVGPGPEERREVGIKNALLDLSRKLSQIGELKRDRAEIVSSDGQTYHVNSQSRVYGQNQPGVILRKAKLRFGNETREILLPTTEATVAEFNGNLPTRLKQGLPIDGKNDKVGKGDLFEVLRVGTPPRSAASLATCGPVESLGNSRTPALMELTGLALGQKMPGLLYALEVEMLTKGIIGPASGFTGEFKWDIPTIRYCIQPVERVDVGQEQCAAQCERQIKARYTLRVKQGNDVLSRNAFESQYKSTGYYSKSTPAEQVQRLIDADVLDEAYRLLEKVVDKINFTSP